MDSLIHSVSFCFSGVCANPKVSVSIRLHTQQGGYVQPIGTGVVISPFREQKSGRGIERGIERESEREREREKRRERE